jgi:hypothetical protein
MTAKIPHEIINEAAYSFEKQDDHRRKSTINYCNVIIHTCILDIDSTYDQSAQAAISKCWSENLSHPKLPLPASLRRTKDLALGNSLSRVVDAALGIQRGLDNGGAPVVGHTVAGKLDTEENDDGANGKTDVPSSRGDVVVLHPPSTVLVTDQLVECPTDENPRKLS